MGKSNLAVKDEELTNNIEVAVVDDEIAKTDVGRRVIEIEQSQTAKKEKTTKVGILYFISKIYTMQSVTSQYASSRLICPRFVT